LSQSGRGHRFGRIRYVMPTFGRQRCHAWQTLLGASAGQEVGRD